MIPSVPDKKTGLSMFLLTLKFGQDTLLMHASAPFHRHIPYRHSMGDWIFYQWVIPAGWQLTADDFWETRLQIG